jgi:CRP-like cAMP-binding protein
MQPENLSVILKNHPFLSGLKHEFLETIIGCATNALFQEGQYLFKENDDADKFYLIRTGKAALEFHAPPKGIIRLQTVSQGEVLGWSWLIYPYKWHFDAIAVETIRAIALDGKCLRNKCKKNPVFGYEMLIRFSEVLESHLKATRLQLLDFYSVAKGEKV